MKQKYPGAQKEPFLKGSYPAPDSAQSILPYHWGYTCLSAGVDGWLGGICFCFC